MDATSGLQYMNARYYQPSTGRFLSQDTYSGNPYDPWTQHLYSYTGNNPINFIDPTGHKSDYVLAASNFGNYKPYIAPKKKDYILAQNNFPQYAPDRKEPKSPYPLAGKNFGDYTPIETNEDIIKTYWPEGLELGSNEMYYVDASVSVGVYTKGYAVVFDKYKYCEYTFLGINKSAGLPVDRSDSRGIVTNISYPSDYEGAFVSAGGAIGPSGLSGSIGVNARNSRLILSGSTTNTSLTATVGGSLTYYYITDENQSTWIYGQAPLNPV